MAESLELVDMTTGLVTAPVSKGDGGTAAPRRARSGRNLKFAAAALTWAAVLGGCSPGARQGSGAEQANRDKVNSIAARWNGYWARYSPPIPGMELSAGPALYLDPEHVFINKSNTSVTLDAYGSTPGNYDTSIPYKPEYKALYMRYVQETIDGRSRDKVAVGCHPYGMPRMMSFGAGVIVTPEVVFILGTGSDVRRIYMDGRPIPDPSKFTHDSVSTWDGYSVGHWEGETLVVKTVHIIGGDYDQTAAPQSDESTVDERISIDKDGRLVDELTVTDPVMLTKPWSVTLRYDRAKDQSHWPNRTVDGCGKYDTVRSDESGAQTVILPSERKD